MAFSEKVHSLLSIIVTNGNNDEINKKKIIADAQFELFCVVAKNSVNPGASQLSLYGSQLFKGMTAEIIGYFETIASKVREIENAFRESKLYRHKLLHLDYDVCAGICGIKHEANGFLCMKFRNVPGYDYPVVVCLFYHDDCEDVFIVSFCTGTSMLPKPRDYPMFAKITQRAFDTIVQNHETLLV
jgi:hypothetical protein